MNKLSLILILLLLFSCEDKKSITFMRCVYHHHELHPEVKKLVDYLFLDKQNEWLFNVSKNDWYKNNTKYRTVNTNFTSENGYYLFHIELYSLANNEKENRSLKLSKSFNEIVYIINKNSNKDSFKRIGTCNKVKMIDVVLEYEKVYLRNKKDREFKHYWNSYPHYSD